MKRNTVINSETLLKELIKVNKSFDVEELKKSSFEAGSDVVSFINDIQSYLGNKVKVKCLSEKMNEDLFELIENKHSYILDMLEE